MITEILANRRTLAAELMVEKTINLKSNFTPHTGQPVPSAKVYTIGCEGGPSPSRLVAKAVTVTLVDRAHGEEAMSNQSLQTPLSQVEAEITVEPQM